MGSLKCGPRNVFLEVPRAQEALGPASCSAERRAGAVRLCARWGVSLAPIVTRGSPGILYGDHISKGYGVCLESCPIAGLLREG